jgi:hypothetical protein
MAENDTPTYAERLHMAAMCAPLAGQLTMFNGLEDMTTGQLTDMWDKGEPVDVESLTQTQAEIVNVCSDIQKMLLEKNRKYGDSALNPSRVFSKANPEEQLKVRIDDKISRMQQQTTDDDEDVINDLIGYLVLLKVARQITPPQIDVSLPDDEEPILIDGGPDMRKETT